MKYGREKRKERSGEGGPEECLKKDIAPAHLFMHKGFFASSHASCTVIVSGKEEGIFLPLAPKSPLQNTFC